jgi:hypothetical protein
LKDFSWLLQAISCVVNVNGRSSSFSGFSCSTSVIACCFPCASMIELTLKILSL